MTQAQLKVMSARLTEAKTKLDYQNRNLQSQIASLRQIEQSLNKMWDGEANDAFHKVFEKDSKQFDEFSQLIKKYSQVLQQAVETYKKTEAKNVQLATQR